jgi:glycosyltransferase involved in cell wall biosynthesis
MASSKNRTGEMKGRNPPMNVLIVTSFPIPGDYDGTAMLPIKIARALMARGQSVALAYLKARRPWVRPALGQFEGMPLYTLCPPNWFSGLRRIQTEHRFDLIHAQHYGGATRAYPATRLFGWPLVYEVHSLLGDEVERDRLGRDWKFRGYQALERGVMRHAARIIVLGEPVKKVLIEEKGVPAGRIDVIYPGIDLAEYEGTRETAQIPGVGPENPVIMYVGSIVHPNQGVPILIAALPKVFAARPDARCVLVGGPADAGDTYRQELAEHGDKLTVLAGKTPEEVVALTRRADVLVHTRLACRENYSVQSKLAVYLAAGKPIVATDFGDYATLLGHTGAGLLTSVDPDAVACGLLRVLNEPDLAARLAAATAPVAREFFGMDRNIERYLACYEHALQQRRCVVSATHF